MKRGHAAFRAAFLLGALLAGCSQEAEDHEPVSATIVTIDRGDLPLEQADDTQLAQFSKGDLLFETPFREADGLGPLYVRSSCAACHADDARGPGTVTRMATPKKPSVAQGPNTLGHSLALLRFGDTVRPYVIGAAKTPILPQEGVRTALRLPPAVFGRGHMEAVVDSEIERLAREAETRGGPIRGRIHRVHPMGAPGTTNSAEQSLGRIGRFGIKARSPDLDDFTADALLGDMGLTSSLRPTEPVNPDGIVDDAKPGIDVDDEAVGAIADYVRLLELPPRTAEPLQGRDLFEDVMCATCHVPALATRPDYPVPQLAGKQVSVYTDFLLHDMGEGLADGVVEGEAGGRDFRTAPLIGLRFLVGYLHDGRAKTLEAAILQHASEGSEANVSVDRFLALGEGDREALMRFVEQL